jgi:predicted transcriptional regulator
MRLSLELSDALQAQLAAVAARLNVPAEELATAALRDLLAQSDAEFRAAAEQVLAKNRELYRRLA